MFKMRDILEFIFCTKPHTDESGIQFIEVPPHYDELASRMSKCYSAILFHSYEIMKQMLNLS